MPELANTVDIRSFAIRGMYEYENLNATDAARIFDTWFNMVVGKAWAEGRTGKDTFTV